MKKVQQSVRILVVAAILVMSFEKAAEAQWATTGNDVYNTNTGKIGIGTSSPGSLLFIGSGSMASGALPGLNVALGGNSYIAASDGTRTAFLGADSSGYGMVGTLTGHDFVIRSNNTERMRVTTSGNVGIGTTSPSTALHVVGDVTVSGNISAKYQDLAEWVPSSQSIPAGFVVVLDRDADNAVVRSLGAYDTHVAGVVSGSPGIVLGEAGDGKVKVATMGRVKVRVDATRAPIQRGDLLVTSEKEGVAMRSEPVNLGGIEMHRPGTLIGKALEPLSEGEGEILVLLSLQ